MKLIRLTSDTSLGVFDYGDTDLNNFLVEEVDAYLSAIDFYIKNDFKPLSEKVESEHTKLMFFDMMELK